MLNIFPSFSGPPPIPRVGGKRKIWTIIGLLLVLAGILAWHLDSPTLINRFGNLIVLAAASFAFWGAVTEAELERWIVEWNDNAEWDAQLSFGQYSLSTEQRLETMSLPISKEFLTTLASFARCDVPAAATYGDFLRILGVIKESPATKELLLQRINRELYSVEFLGAAVGIVVASFGDVIFVFIAFALDSAINLLAAASQ